MKEKGAGDWPLLTGKGGEAGLGGMSRKMRVTLWGKRGRRRGGVVPCVHVSLN